MLTDATTAIEALSILARTITVVSMFLYGHVSLTIVAGH